VDFVANITENTTETEFL